jgi:hypothetical protein
MAKAGWRKEPRPCLCLILRDVAMQRVVFSWMSRFRTLRSRLIPSARGCVRAWEGGLQNLVWDVTEKKTKKS